MSAVTSNPPKPLVSPVHSAEDDDDSLSSTYFVDFSCRCRAIDSDAYPFRLHSTVTPRDSEQ